MICCLILGLFEVFFFFFYVVWLFGISFRRLFLFWVSESDYLHLLSYLDHLTAPEHATSNLNPSSPASLSCFRRISRGMACLTRRTSVFFLSSASLRLPLGFPPSPSRLLPDQIC